MNTPTKRIFYLFEPKFAKNEPQTKVWGSLTCKSQFLRLAESVSCAFAEAGSVPVRAGRSRSRLVVQPFAAAFTPVAAACARSRCSRWSRTFALVAASSAHVRAGRSRLRALALFALVTADRRPSATSPQRSPAGRRAT